MMSVFNEEDLLEESVSSVAPYVDEVVVFDGPFLEYPRLGRVVGEVEMSGDRTPEIAVQLRERFGNVQYEALGRMSENDKRSRMFDCLSDGDLAFILDGDEIVYGDVVVGVGTAVELASRGRLVSYVQVLDLRAARDWRPRFVLKKGRMCYDDWVRLYSDDRVVFDLKNQTVFQPRVPDMGIVNLRLHYRGKEREGDGAACKEALLAKVK